MTLSGAFLNQEYWSGLPFPSPGDLPDPGIEPTFPVLQADSLPLSHRVSPKDKLYVLIKKKKKKRKILVNTLDLPGWFRIIFSISLSLT